MTTTMMTHLTYLLPALLLVLGAHAWYTGRTRVSSAPAEAATVRVASLKTAGEPGGWGWWLAVLASWVPLGATAWYLSAHWSELPARFPVHYGANGVANRWVERSPGSVYSVLVIAAVLALLFGVFGELVARYSPGYEGSAVARRTTMGILLGSAWFVALLFCGLAMLPLQVGVEHVVPLILISSTLFLVGAVGYAAYIRWREGDALAAGRATTDGSHWRWGVVYYNPEDAAVMVPKREGLGYTMNFARPVTWVVLGALVGVHVVLLVVVGMAHKR